MNNEVEEIIKACRKTAEALEKVEDKDNSEEVNKVLTTNLGATICCNACQALSSFCVPDSAPNKCKGGCTVTSFAF